MVSQQRSARLFVELMVKGLVAAERNGSHWSCWRISFHDQLGKRGELLKEGIPVVGPVRESNWQESFQLGIGSGPAEPLIKIA